MIIIPEIETVVLQPPRTGTTSLRDAIIKRYPRAFLLYRHMEADGIPFGYTHWRRVCQVRDPFERLLSLYFYMRQPIIKERTCLAWVKRVTEASNKPFDEWLEDITVFTSPGIPNKDLRPRDAIMWAGPDQKKSQYLWAKGANALIHNEDLEQDALAHLDVQVGHTNKSTGKIPMIPSDVASHFLNKYHSWDVECYREY